MLFPDSVPLHMLFPLSLKLLQPPALPPGMFSGGSYSSAAREPSPREALSKWYRQNWRPLSRSVRHSQDLTAVYKHLQNGCCTGSPHQRPLASPKPHQAEKASLKCCRMKQETLSFPSWQSPGKTPRSEGSAKILMATLSPQLKTHAWLLRAAGLKSKGLRDPQCSVGLSLCSRPPPHFSFKGARVSPASRLIALHGFLSLHLQPLHISWHLAGLSVAPSQGISVICPSPEFCGTDHLC